MKRINLREHYPFYEYDLFLEVTDKLAELLKLLNRKDHADYERRRAHKAYYSLDADDGIERNFILLVLSPEEIYERKLSRQELYAAVNSLPEKQAKRIYAHYFLGMSKAEIARMEGVTKVSVTLSIIRVNSGGTVLSKSDLLFSTIVANWEKAREEIEELLKAINNKGDKFDFDNDFVMRLCLVLEDCPVLFKVNNFKKDNVDKIKNNWNAIKEALKKTVDLLVEFGFSQDNLTSRNVIIPIVYHIFKGGNLGDGDKRNIRIYLITSLLKQIYGGKGDQVLESIRIAMRKEEGGKYVLKNLNFDLKALASHKFPADKTFTFTCEDIDSLFEYKKSPYTFMVLSLLYPHLKLGQVKFHQDHLHPISSFTNANLRKSGADIKKWDEWVEAKDKLANLQLLEGLENESKNKTPLKDWLENNTQNLPAYKATNYIPDIDLSLINFEDFIMERKKLMIQKIKEVMEVV